MGLFPKRFRQFRPSRWGRGQRVLHGQGVIDFLILCIPHEDGVVSTGCDIEIDKPGNAWTLLLHVGAHHTRRITENDQGVAVGTDIQDDRDCCRSLAEYPDAWLIKI